MRSELELRFQLWEKGSLEELLVRIEEQARCATELRAGAAPSAGKGARARRLAQAGAYRKGVASLMSSSADLPLESQESWCRKLLPCSDNPHALSTPRSREQGAPEPAHEEGGGGRERKVE